jgi:hypothetical protein
MRATTGVSTPSQLLIYDRLFDFHRLPLSRLARLPHQEVDLSGFNSGAGNFRRKRVQQYRHVSKSDVCRRQCRNEILK